MINGRRMFEPGFLAVRLPFLRSILRNYNPGPLFLSLGMMPIENQLGSREIASLAWSLQRAHGPQPVSVFFDDGIAATFAPGTKTDQLLEPGNFEKAQTVVKLSALREPYRRELLEETRRLVDRDLAAMEDVVRRGATFYVTPEGFYSTDGRLGRMKGVYDRLASYATVYLFGVSYDSFVSKRLSILYRIVRLDDKSKLKEVLAAARPITMSHLLGAWLENRATPFSTQEAIDGVTARMRDLPAQLFVDPELKRDPARLVRAALPLMVEWGILLRDGDRYALTETRRHPQFPLVGDVVAYQARFLEESIANAPYSMMTVVE
jgi:hypothetical protein